MSLLKTSIWALLLGLFLPTLSPAQSSIYQDTKNLAAMMDSIPVIKLSFLLKNNFSSFAYHDSEFGTIELIKDGEILNLPVNKQGRVDYSITSFGTYLWENTISNSLTSVTSDTLNISLKDSSFVLGGNTLTIVRIDYSPDSLTIKSEHRTLPLTVSNWNDPRHLDPELINIEHYAVALNYRDMTDIMRAHTDFESTFSDPAQQFERTLLKYQANPFFERLGRKRKMLLPERGSFTANLSAPPRGSFSEFYQKNYEWHRLLYGDSTLQLQKEVSYKDVVSSYREPVASAQNELIDANKKINARAKKKNRLDAKSVAVGLSDFIAERAQEELNLTFFNRFKENLRDSSELTVLFPNTRKLLYQFEISDYKTLLSHAREAFSVDLENLGLNFPNVLSLPKYEELLDNSPDVYNLSLIFSIVNLAYKDVGVENIMIATYKDLESRKERMTINIDKALADTLFYEKERMISNMGIGMEMEELASMVSKYINDVDVHKQGILESSKILEEVLSDSLYDFVETANPMDFYRAEDRYAAILKPIIKTNKENRVMNYFGERKVLFRYSEFTEPSYLDFYKKITRSNLYGFEYYGYLLEDPDKTPEEYAMYFNKDEYPVNDILARGISSSRQLLDEPFLEILAEKQEELESSLFEVQRIKTNLETLRGKDNEPFIAIENLVAKVNLLKIAIDHEIDFWENNSLRHKTSHDITALLYLKSMLENERDIVTFMEIQNLIHQGNSIGSIKSQHMELFQGEGSIWGGASGEPKFATVLEETNNLLYTIQTDFEKKILQLENTYDIFLFENNSVQQKKAKSDLLLNAYKEIQYEKNRIVSTVKFDPRIIDYQNQLKALDDQIWADENNGPDTAAMVAYDKLYDMTDSLKIDLKNYAVAEFNKLDQKWDSLLNSDIKIIADMNATETSQAEPDTPVVASIVVQPDASEIAKSETTIPSEFSTTKAVENQEISLSESNAFLNELMDISIRENQQIKTSYKIFGTPAEIPPKEGLICLADSLASVKMRFENLENQRKNIKDYLSKLEKKYCPNLVKARDNADNFAKGIELATHLLFAFRYNEPDALVYYDTSQMKITMNLIDTLNNTVIGTSVLDTINVTKKFIEETAKNQNSTRWITRKEFEALKANEVEWNLFLGLLYQRLRSIDDAPNFSTEGIALLATKFLSIVQDVEENRIALRLKKATNPDAVNFKDYYPFIRSTVDLFNTVLTTRAINHVKPIDALKDINPTSVFNQKRKKIANRFRKDKEKKSANLDKKRTAKVDEEQYIVQSFSKQDSSLQSIPNISNEALSLYENMFAQKYSKAILNSMELLRTITSSKLNAKERRKAERSINAVLFYGSFMSGMIKAETSDQVKSILKSATVPPGSSRIKRETTSSFTINSYLGAAFARDVLIDAPEGVKRTSFGAAMSVPIGFTYSVSPNWIKNKSSISLFVPLIDLGAITAYRQNPKNDNYSIESLPEIKWSNLFSPGVFAVYNFANNPFSLGVGGQYGPQLRKIQLKDTTDPVFVNSFRFPMVFFNIDVPFFNLHTGSRKIIVN